MIQHVIVYTRVSTEEQARDGVSLEAQRDLAQKWVDLNCPKAEVHFAADEGMTGSKMARRPGLMDAIKKAETLPDAALVVYSLSRLSRSTQDTLWIAAKLEKNGCELVSLSEKIDTTTAAGRMVFRMLAVLCEFERDQIAERTRAAIMQLRSKGKRFSRFEQYGEATEKRCYELRKLDLTYRQIATRMGMEGHETMTGAPWGATMCRRLALRWEQKLREQREASSTTD